MKKSPVAKELANSFPSWSRIRQTEQSVGFQLLNAVSQPMERMEKELIRAKANYYLPTVNLDEIDITYKLALSNSFEFATDNTDPLSSSYAAPVASGLVGATWYDISLAEDNSLQNFWYDSIPTRVSLADTVSGVDDFIYSGVAEDMPASGVWEHYAEGGALWVECTGGTQYIQLSNGTVLRAMVVIEGTTRRGVEDTESLIFPWDMKQRTRKEWREITSINAFNMEDEVEISVSSADFNAGPYLSVWNTRYSDNRSKIDEFWDLGSPVASGMSVTLDRVEYATDEWEQLIGGFSSTQVVEKWELLDASLQTISGLDLALQPFTDRAWVVTSDKKLFCYDISEQMPDNLSLVKDRTSGTDVLFETETPSLVLGETLQILPWHARPVKEIARHRIWYQSPSGTKYGILAGGSVPWGTDLWVYNPEGTLQRTIGDMIEITPAERGEYTFTLEVVYIDGDTHTEKLIIPVNYKIPLVELDISALVPQTPVGIEFSSDQHLWVKGTSHYYRINLHSDVMLVDYDQKVIYFKEEYDSVGVDSE